MIMALPACVAAILAFAVSWLLVARADRLGLTQIANHRSSHTKPTATGGGLGICLGTLAGSFILFRIETPLALTLCLATLVAVVGLVDDRWSLPAWVRLLAQFAAIGALIWIASGTANLADGAGLAAFLAIAGIAIAGVWWINLFNFMDGIDGYAATEAIFMLGALPFLGVWQGTGTIDAPLAIVAITGSTATAGFLILNWPPARIFMGDAGSTFLGFLIFALALFSSLAGWMSGWQWLIIGALFSADATVTLIRRALRGEPIHQAHNLHGYQRLARRWGNHRRVTWVLIAVDVAILLPLAILADAWPGLAPAIGIATFLLAAAAMVGLGAGKADGR